MEGRLPDYIFYIYFSPYTAHGIEINGSVFNTVEHAYQCQRYSDSKIISEIKNASSPLKAWQVSSKYKHLQLPDFPSRKLEVMKNLLRLKTRQHEEVRQALADSGDQMIVKHVFTYPPGDGFWDEGENGEGQNQMGRLWMEIRDEINKDQL